ncbi:MAG: hypothetical protein RJA99_4231 [Pseudomonadota bacterium]|jgi:hypothetical protein
MGTITVKDGAGVNQTVARVPDTGNSVAVADRLPVVAAGYDAGDDMMKVKSVQKKYRDSFSGAVLDPARWDSSVGTGGSITVSGGTLTMASGTTADAVVSAITKETFTIPFRVVLGLTLSQRIANQTFWVEALSVNPSTGVPDGQHSVAWRFDGTTATQAIYETQNGGLARLASAASTVVTTAASGVYEIEPYADEVWWHSGTMDAVTSRANSYRRHQQIPDPNAVFKVQLRWVNGSTPPASGTNAVMQFIAVQDYAELTAEITAGRGNAVAGNAISVNLAGAASATTPIGQVTLAATQTLATVTNSGTPAAPATPYILNSAASTNAALVLTGSSGLHAFYATNTGATAAFVKLFNKATAPTVGTDVPALILPVPAAVGGVPGVCTLPIGTNGFRFALGLGIAITGAAADTDTTAVAAGQVKVMLSRTV